MKTTICTILMLLCACYTLDATAQRKRVAAKMSVRVKNAKTAEQENTLFKSMLKSTAKVIFIDSIVVDKDRFLSAIPQREENGRIMSAGGVSEYVNGFSDRRIYAEGDTVKGRSLYMEDKIGGGWGDKRKLDFGDDFKAIDFPFLTSDGVTLFFAAKGEKSMGGYDIFTTNVSMGDGSVLTPTNYGLPYNSTANDYLLVINDIDSLGWLVSDRNQPAGKVCIYVFVPTATRSGYDGDAITDEQLAGYANVTNISDTWKFGDRKAALERLRRMEGNDKSETDFAANISFVVNDDIVYKKKSDFKHGDTWDMYVEAMALREKLSADNNSLEKLYREYQTATSDRQRLRLMEKIERTEKTVEEERGNIKTIEKNIRKKELKAK